jgi:KEOPS complex subunit Cgi121
MHETHLLFGRPTIRERDKFLSALRDLQASSGFTIQAVDAGKVASERHLTFAVKKALLAFREGRNVAKDLGVEILRYIAGDRQIERAFAFGLSESTERIAVIMVRVQPGEEWPDTSALLEVDGMGCSSTDESLRSSFDIPEEEIRAAGEGRIPDLVLERVALVDVYR